MKPTGQHYTQAKFRRGSSVWSEAKERKYRRQELLKWLWKKDEGVEIK